MKKLIAVAVLLFAGHVAAYSQDGLTGEDIAKKAHDSNRSAEGIVVKGRMAMTDLSVRSSESREVVVLSVREGGLSKSMIRFTDSSYRGTTMLTMERSGQDNLQYLYLPSVGSPRQIEGSDREKSFVDTDFSNEDLGGSRIQDYTYSRLADRKTGIGDCYVIERFPKNRSSKYSKHVVTIEKTSMIPVEVQFYAKSGRVVKSLRAGQIKQISGNVRVPMHMEVVDIEKRHQTVIDVSSAQEKSINRGYFNRNRMSMQWSE